MIFEQKFFSKRRNLQVFMISGVLSLFFPQTSYAGSAVINSISGTTCTTSNYPVTQNYAVAFTAGSSSTITSVEVAVSATHTTTNDTLTVYASSGSNASINIVNTPLAYFSYTSKTGPYTATNNYNILTFVGSFTPVAGTNYWIAFNGTGSGFVCLDSNASTYSNSWTWYNYNSVYYWNWIGRGSNWSITQHMNLNMFANTSVTTSIQISTNSNFATYNSQKILNATLPIAGSDGLVTFYANNKKIPGCIKVKSNSLLASCNWKPIKHGAVTITANLFPLDTTYLPSQSLPVNILVTTRGNYR